MPTITIIGAGGYVFPLTLIRDIVAFPELCDSTIVMMDIDAKRLEDRGRMAQQLIDRYKLPTRIVTTIDRRMALRNAEYVVIAFQVGGLAAYQMDVEIPRRYGLDQCVGDTLGPGGVFRGLRTIPVLLDIARDMQELCPNALLLQYANPMATNCWALNTTGIANVGLCHSVQNTSHMLARQLGITDDALQFRVAGINHQAWFLELRSGNVDMYPQLREVMQSQHGGNQTASVSRYDTDHSQQSGEDTVYEGGQERVRTAILQTFGYFHTESSHHASEYVPYFRKSPDLVHTYLPERWDYYELCAAHNMNDPMSWVMNQGLTPSHEYGAYIIHSCETNTPRVIYGNVENTGLIQNLPSGCCVEVPCLVDSNGVQPITVGVIPPQCAALNHACIHVQQLAVHGAIHGDRDAVHHAIALDPLTSAVLTLPQIHAMVAEMFRAESPWLPQFQ